MPTVFGAELSLGLTRPQNGVADPEGTHLLVLARDPTGYTRLCRALSVAHLFGRGKGRPLVDLALLAAIGAGADLDLSTISMSDEPCLPSLPATARAGGTDHWVVLTGAARGSSPALVSSGPGAGPARTGAACSAFRPGQRGGGAVGPRRPARLGPQRRPRRHSPPAAAPRSWRPTTSTTTIPARRRWPPPWPRCGPGAAWTTSTAGCRPRPPPTCAAGPSRPAASPATPGGGAGRRAGPGVRLRPGAGGAQLPPWPTPAGHTEMSWLRQLTEEGAGTATGPGTRPAIPGPGPRSTTSWT